MTFPQLLEHFIITFIGWGLGTGLGWIMGKALVPLLQKFDTLTGKGRLFILLVPWRTIIASVFLINLYPIIPMYILGIGSKVGIFSVALVMFFITIMIIGETSKTFSKHVSFAVRSTSWVRSLAVLAVVIATHYGGRGGGGLGFLVQQYLNTLQRTEYATLLGWIAGIALVLDLFFGIIQFQFCEQASQRSIPLTED